MLYAVTGANECICYNDHIVTQHDNLHDVITNSAGGAGFNAYLLVYIRNDGHGPAHEPAHEESEQAENAVGEPAHEPANKAAAAINKEVDDNNDDNETSRSTQNTQSNPPTQHATNIMQLTQVSSNNERNIQLNIDDLPSTSSGFGVRTRNITNKLDYWNVSKIDKHMITKDGYYFRAIVDDGSEQWYITSEVLATSAVRLHNYITTHNKKCAKNKKLKKIPYFRGLKEALLDTPDVTIDPVTGLADPGAFLGSTAQKQNLEQLSTAPKSNLEQLPPRRERFFTDVYELEPDDVMSTTEEESEPDDVMSEDSD